MWQENDDHYIYRKFHTAEKAEQIRLWCDSYCKVTPYYSRQPYDDGSYEVECRFTDPDDAAFFRMKWG